MWWKIYTWLLAVFLVLSYSFIIAATPTIVDLIDIPISIVAWLGLLAFSYSKRFLFEPFWRTWLVMIIGWDIIYNFVFAGLLGIGQEIQGMDPVTVVEAVVGLVLLVPEYYAIFLYGFRRQEIWYEKRT